MRKASSGTSGFSLVEVALSLAILAVGMTGVLALLPVGLDGARQVHAETVASQVVRGAIADFATNGNALGSFQTVAQVPNGQVLTNVYYTQEGVRTNQAGGYFLLTFVKGRGAVTDPSCRYFLSLSWPYAAMQANSNSPLLQKRTFVTDVVRL